jgi:signal transduction histidine kinase/CheY-like chemotaxis protein
VNSKESAQNPSPTLDDTGDLIASWRAKMAERITAALAYLGFLAYLPSVWLSVRSGYYGVAIVDTLVYAAVVLLYLRRDTFSCRVRSYLISALFFGLGVFLIETVGPFGAGPLWLFSFSILSALLYDTRGTVLALSLTFATLGLMALRLGLGFLLPVGANGSSVSVFVVIAANFALLSGILAAGIGAIFRGLARETVARRKAENDLQQAQKLEAIGTLVGGMAHDLNNALQPILMYARLAQEEIGPSHPSHGDLDMIVSSTQRARELIRRMMTFGRRSKAVRTPLHIVPLLEHTVETLRGMVPEDIGIDVDFDNAVDAMIEGEVGEVQQIVMNLAANAFLAMGNGGELKVRSTLQDDEPRLQIEVTDTGSGMSESTLSRAFDPFFTTRKQGEASGLGLAVVHGIVKSMKGTISLTSKVGAGTNVTVRLPLLRLEKREDPPQRPLPRQGHGERILLIDDERAVLETTERQLISMGYEVEAFGSPLAALERFRMDPDDFDILVTDLTMPQMSGISVIEEIRALKAEVSVVLATGYLDGDDAQKVGEGIPRIQKPYSPEELANAVRIAQLRRK